MKLSKHSVAAGVTVVALSLSAAYGMAQGRPGPHEKKPAAPATADAGAARACAHEDCKHGDMHCPMGALSGLAEVKLEKTKTGATLQLTAKDPAKVAEVQTLAEKMAEHLKAGDCPMMEAGEGHAHEHQHGHPSAPAK